MMAWEKEAEEEGGWFRGRGVWECGVEEEYERFEDGQEEREGRLLMSR